MTDTAPDPGTTTGRYAYSRDGVDVPVNELYVVWRGSFGTRVEVERTAPGTRLACDVSYDAAGKVKASFMWTSDVEGTDAASTAAYSYVPNEGSPIVGVERSVAGVVTRENDVTEADLQFFPLMRVFSGRTLLALAASANGLPVLVPDIRDPGDLSHWLAPLVDVRRATSDGGDEVEVDGRARAAHRLDYLGGSYEAAATVWVDDGGLLLRYAWDQPGVGMWDVRLTDVEGDWPTPPPGDGALRVLTHGCHTLQVPAA